MVLSPHSLLGKGARHGEQEQDRYGDFGANINHKLSTCINALWLDHVASLPESSTTHAIKRQDPQL